MTRPPSPLLAAALAALAALAPALAGCNTGFDPQYRVTDVRILAIRGGAQGSSSADVAPGDTLQLDALVANPLGRAPLTLTWFGCWPGPSEAPLPCLERSVLADPARLASTPGVKLLGTGPTLAVPVPPPDPDVDVTAALDFVKAVALADPAYRCVGYAELGVVLVAEAGDRREVAVKRVRITRSDLLWDGGAGSYFQYALNRNPTVDAGGDAVRAPADATGCSGGSSIGTGPFPAGRTTLCARPDPGSVQAYRQCSPDPAGATESLSWQWYVTAGEFPEFGSGVGNATGTPIDFTPPGGAFTLWAIVRDGRGGTAWLERPVPAP